MLKNNELIEIIDKFANSGWDLIAPPAKAWLTNTNNPQATSNLISAIEKADLECGSCGCEFDPLYKQALHLLNS